MKPARALLLAVVLATGCHSLPQDALFKSLEKRDHAETKRLLDEHKNWSRLTDRYGISPLMVAASRGDLESTKLLVERGAYVNYQENRDGWTAIMGAASNGHHEVVSLLTKKDAYLDLANKKGERAITLAAQRGHEAVVRILIAAKAPVNFPDGGMPALNAAILGGNYPTVVAVVEGGADLHTEFPMATGGGKWPKPLALARGRKLGAIEAYLVSKGAD